LSSLVLSNSSLFLARASKPALMMFPPIPGGGLFFLNRLLSRSRCMGDLGGNPPRPGEEQESVGEDTSKRLWVVLKEVDRQ
jgi:hypothetical protein